MKIGRLYISGKDGVTTAPAETIWLINIPFLPLMIWIKPLKKKEHIEVDGEVLK